MFRKALALSVALLLSVGAIFAEDFTGIFKKYADGKVTISIDDKEKEFKVDGEAKMKVKRKGEEKEVLIGDYLKDVKADSKIKLTVEKDSVTKVERVKK